MSECLDKMGIGDGPSSKICLLGNNVFSSLHSGSAGPLCCSAQEHKHASSMLQM